MNLQSIPLRRIYLIFFVIQLTLVSLTFPITELLSQLPLFHIDNAAHWYRITVATNLAEVGNSTGYDPFFNAGTVTGITANPAAKIPALIGSFVAPYLSTTQIWKLYVFLASCIAGICTPLALGFMRQNIRVIVGVGVFGLLLWWVSVFRWYHTAGMVSFVLASYLTMPFIGLVYGYLNGRGNWLSLICTGLLGAIGMYVHPLFPLPVACWTVIYLALNWHGVNARRIVVLITVVPLISLLPNSYWLYLVFVAERLTIGVSGISHQTVVDWNLIWMELMAIWQTPAQGAKMYPLLALGTIWGNIFIQEKESRKLVQAFTIAGLFWICYAAFGASISVLAKWTQPNRFAPVGYLMFVVPAAFGAVNLVASLAKKRTPVFRLAVFATASAVVLLTAINLNELRREVSEADIGHYGAVPPEVSQLGPYSRFILDWLDKNTAPTARILFETSNGRVHDDYHIAGYLTYTADREFIGGPYVYSYFANFTDGFLFGEDISNLSTDVFREYVELYNLGWIIAHSEQSKQYFDSIDWLKPLGTYKQLATYKINRPHSYFKKGSGRVAERDHNKLVLDGLSGDEVILKYHYMRRLRTEPVTTISPIHFFDDPNPFLKIENPPYELTIFFN